MDNSKEVLNELKGWLQMGIQCLGSDTIHSENEKLRLDEKLATMRMVLIKIGELERSL